MITYFFALVTFVYFSVSAGIPVYLHFCGGELEDVSYITKEVECCGEPVEDEEDNDCCKNENLVVKFEADGVINEFNIDLQHFEKHFQIVNTPVLSLKLIFNNTALYKFYTSPPRLYQSSVIATSVLRI